MVRALVIGFCGLPFVKEFVWASFECGCRSTLLYIVKGSLHTLKSRGSVIGTIYRIKIS